MIKPIEDIRWFHSMDLGNGIQTPGKKAAEALLQEAEIIFRFPLTGKSVLDVGAWDGFFSFEAKRRGAERVLATDHFCWSGTGWGTKDGFDTARHILKCRVESLDIDVTDISPETTGKFDVVLFLGVLYHLRHPFFGLEKMAAVTQECLVVETSLDLLDVDRPAAAFYPGRELDNDPTNWWGMNPAAVAGMLGVLGFKRVEYVEHPLTIGTPNPRGIFHAYWS